MMQQDIRDHYQEEWAARGRAAGSGSAPAYSDAVQDAVIFPIYERLIRDARLRADHGTILDVGSGSGRWIRFFLDRHRPARLTGIDFAASSIELLRQWHHEAMTPLSFEIADVTEPGLDLGRFDLINVANVLFHVPEPDRFQRALENLARMLEPDGGIVTTEFLPRVSMRTQWMLVRSRSEFEHAVNAAGLRIAEVRAAGFFTNEPMGIDGPDSGLRRHFHRVREKSRKLLASATNVESRRFIIDFLTDIERAALGYVDDHLAAAACPGQKLVLLRRV